MRVAVFPRNGLVIFKRVAKETFGLNLSVPALLNVFSVMLDCDGLMSFLKRPGDEATVVQRESIKCRVHKHTVLKTASQLFAGKTLMTWNIL